MPFERNYGLTVGFDSVALLAPLAVAYFAVHIGKRRHAIALLALAFLFTTVFQARGLMLQVIIALAATLVMRRPGRAWMLIPVFAAIAFATAQLSSVDELSTEGRTAVQDRIFADVRADPGSFLTGRDQYSYFIDAVRHAGGEALVNAFAGFETVPIHNFLLSNLVAGGWLAFLTLIGAYATVLIVAFQRWRADRSDLISQTLLVAAVLVTFESAIEPVAANIAGLWLVFGFVLGRGLPSKRSANEVPALYPPQNETLTPLLPRSANRA
jgi:O-antigen ligase